MSSTDVQLRLSRDEALVLFELAARFTDDDTLSIAHDAERTALWNLCALLEAALVEPLTPEYTEALAAARLRLARESG